MPDVELKNNTAEGDASPTRLHRLLVPSMADWVFVSILCWLFFGHAGATTLLGDGDTGWHIRTGEYVLANQRVSAGRPILLLDGRRNLVRLGMAV